MCKRRVVITGGGVISPIGNDLNSFWENIKKGTCGIDFVKAFDVEDYPCKLAAEVKDFDPSSYIDKKEAKRMDRFTQFAIVACKEAVKNSKLDLEKIDKDRFGVILGCGIGGLNTFTEQHNVFNSKGPGRVSPFFIPMMIANIAAGQISIMLGARGVNETVVTACAAGTNAIGNAFRNIREGHADIMITGGTEACINPMAFAGFCSMKAMTTSTDPSRASIPFDLKRDGFVIAEGAGLLVIEEYEHAKNRGADIIAEIVGYGVTNDAYHMTAPIPDGVCAAKAMQVAIEDAGIRPEDIGYINAHGTSTPYNDKYETMAVKSVFKDYAHKVMISSTKSMTGHLLGAVGGIEGIICAFALKEGFIPATINYRENDPECDLDYVVNQSRNKEINYTISNSFGFGGQNACIVMKKI